MKKILVKSIVAIALGLTSHSYAQFAGAVVDYTPGNLSNSEWDTGNPFNNPNAVLGQPSGIVDPIIWPNVYSPFSPPDDTTSLTGIGAGGQLTLQLQNYVTVSPGALEIGVWSNVCLLDVSPGYVGTVGTPAATLSTPNSAVVSVSADGNSWVPLNGGNPITFSLPGNYYLNAGPYDSSAPANAQLANFNQPFIVSGSAGTLSSFDGENYAQILSTLNGSAGGTWLNLDSTGLSEVGYIRFDEPLDYTGELDLSTVSINSTLTGAALPEPGSAGLLLVGAGGMLAMMKRRRA